MNKTIEGISKNALQGYLETRKTITRHADRIVAVTHLMGLLRNCDGVVEVDTDSLATVADLIDQDICRIQEELDGFVYVGDAEEALEKP